MPDDNPYNISVEKPAEVVPSPLALVKPDNDEKQLLGNSWTYNIIDPYYSSTYKDMKGAAYLEEEKATAKSLYAEKQFKEMHPGCVILEKGPYNKEELDILHENYRREGSTRDALEFQAQIIVGRRTDLIMSPPQAYADEQRENAEIKRLNQDTESLKLLDELAQIDADVGLNDHLQELLISKNNFGRAVQVVIRDDDGIPTALIPLASVKLGKIYLSYDWRFLGVEYKDYQGDKRILRAEDIIHMENNDYHISPNMRWFGLSQMETVMYIAASLRVSNEVAAPEIHKQQWAPTRDVYAPDAKDQASLDTVALDQRPGATWVHNYKADVQTIKPEIDIHGFEDSIDARSKRIYRAAGVPLVKSWQDEQNRATAQAAIAIYEATGAAKQRTQVRNVLEPQWYVPNLRALIRRRQKLKQEFGELAPYANEGLVNTLERTAVEPPSESKTTGLPFVPKMQFLPITIDSYLERTAATIEWVKIGALTKPEGLEASGLEKYKEAAMAREAEKLKNRFMTPPNAEIPEAQTSDLADTKGLPGTNLSDVLQNTTPPMSRRLPRGGSDIETELRIELLRKKIKATEDFNEAINLLKKAA